MRGVDQSGNGTFRMFGSAVFFQQPAENMSGKVFAFLGHVGGDAEIDVGVVGCAVLG